MFKSTTIYCYLFILILLSGCGTTQKLRMKELENRISNIELENQRLTKENNVIKAQLQVLLNNLPKPGGATPNTNTATASPVLQFDKTIHNFGTIEAGAAVTHTFTFKNTGDFPLIIQNARASCGCTVPQWPKEPIAAGAEGQITVTFNSKGKSGHQHKSVTITANTNPAETRLYIKALISD